MSTAILEHQLLTFLLKPYHQDALPAVTVRDGKVVSLYPMPGKPKLCLQVAQRLLVAGLLDPVPGDRFGHHAVNDRGRAIAAQPAPPWLSPPPPDLDQDDLEVLEAAESLHASQPDYFFTPMDVGGTSNSDHSRRLLKLARHGYVEIKQRTSSKPPVTGDAVLPRPTLRTVHKGSKCYRITDAGLVYLQTISSQKKAS